MEDLLEELRKLIKHGCYLAALQTALLIPSICGALQSDDGLDSNVKYKEWARQFSLTSAYIDPEDLYFFRCSILHQYKNTHPKSKYSQIIFLPPNERGNIIHANIFNDVLNIDIVTFCNEIIKSVENWLSLIANDSNYLNNKEKCFQKHVNGLHPYIIGTTVYGIKV